MQRDGVMCEAGGMLGEINLATYVAIVEAVIHGDHAISGCISAMACMKMICTLKLVTIIYTSCSYHAGIYYSCFDP